MKDSRGFTLIELLACILILGIIMLISVPTVANIIAESKKELFKVSIENLNKAVEEKCQIEKMENEYRVSSYTFKDGTVDNEIAVKGILPKSGTIIVNGGCKTSMAISDGKYCAQKEISSSKIEIVNIEDSECKLIDYVDVNDEKLIYEYLVEENDF